MAGEELALYKLRDDIFVKICKSIESCDFDSFKRNVPPDWSGPWKSKNCTANELLNEFRKRGVTVQQLAILLHDLQFEEPMSYIVDDNPVSLTQDLPEDVVVCEGKSLVLKCKAVGYLFPKYQWYRCLVGNEDMLPIANQKSNVLEMPEIRPTDAGSYVCHAYNYDKKGRKFTQSTVTSKVTVLTDSLKNSNIANTECMKPIITFQPSPSRQVEIGSNILLEVTAEGQEPLNFEWYEDGQPIPNSNVSRYEILKVQPKCERRRWTYQCRVSNAFGVVMSDIVDVVLAPFSIKTQYKAEDKVALLIGNGNYANLHLLNSAVEDVVTLALKLKSVGFKVIALSDLNLVEMNNAVKLFCSLLDEGVYGVFYYAGHGFESNNQRYMLPVNADNNHNFRNSLCAEYIQTQMQKKTPALVALFLDMCRTESESRDIELKREGFELYKPAPHPNFVIAYATTSGSKAFELQGQQNGIFASYLKKFIAEPISVKEVMEKVIVAVNNDRVAGHVQHPCVYHALCEAISLTDPIQTTSLLSRDRLEIFHSITRCPNGFVMPLSPKFPQIEVKMEVRPHKQCLLNGIDVAIRVLAKNTRPHFKLDDEKIVIKPIEIDYPVHENICAISILGLQRLRKNILGSVYFFDTVREQREEQKLDLGTPLIMPANLWELKQDSAIPVEEDSWIDPRSNSNNDLSFFD